MKRTHLALALISATKDTTITDLAAKASVAQSTLSRLISTERRIDIDTLRALYTNLEREPADKILLNHILDEITRAGGSTLEWQIASRGAREDSDLSVLELAISGPHRLKDFPEMVRHLANLARRQFAAEAALPMAAEDPGPYGKKKK